jgi:Ser/Thr protein kinase RdoA (MazF antagonist)
MAQFEMTQFEHDNGSSGGASCQRVLARFVPRVVPLRVDSLGNRGGFSGAALWRVVTGHGDFALRRWPRPGLPRPRIFELHRLLEHLRREGLTCVAVPLPTDDGSTLVSEAGHDWQLEPWLPGVADFHDDPSRERLRAAMDGLARWHLAASRYVPADGGSQWFAGRGPSVSPAVAERLEILAGADEETMQRVESRITSATDSSIRGKSRRILELFRSARTTVINELELLREVRVPLHPCLRDVWHDHVLFTGDRVTGLIDPSACRTEVVACDLSRLIGSLVGDDCAAWDFAIGEYQRRRHLSVGERALVPVFDRSGVLLAGWTWLEWLYLERRSIPDLAAVERRLNEILPRMELLAAGACRARKLIVP